MFLRRGGKSAEGQINVRSREKADTQLNDCPGRLCHGVRVSESTHADYGWRPSQGGAAWLGRMPACMVGSDQGPDSLWHLILLPQNISALLIQETSEGASWFGEIVFLPPKENAAWDNNKDQPQNHPENLISGSPNLWTEILTLGWRGSVQQEL